MKHAKSYPTPIGKMTLIEENGAILEILFDEGIVANGEETDLLKWASSELEEYFQGKRMSFSFPIQLYGTPFQKRVWNALIDIPYGQTATYGEIAKIAGNAKASRAVGMANHNNRLPIVIPCHRVIGSTGKMVGYALGLDKKIYLLDLEKQNMQK